MPTQVAKVGYHTGWLWEVSGCGVMAHSWWSPLLLSGDPFWEAGLEARRHRGISEGSLEERRPPCPPLVLRGHAEQRAKVPSPKLQSGCNESRPSFQGAGRIGVHQGDGGGPVVLLADLAAGSSRRSAPGVLQHSRRTHSPLRCRRHRPRQQSRECSTEAPPPPSGPPPSHALGSMPYPSQQPCPP